MSIKMPLSKILNPEQQHWSCSLATGKDINRKPLEALLCKAGRLLKKHEPQLSCFLKDPQGPHLFSLRKHNQG